MKVKINLQRVMDKNTYCLYPLHHAKWRRAQHSNGVLHARGTFVDYEAYKYVKENSVSYSEELQELRRKFTEAGKYDGPLYYEATEEREHPSPPNE